MQGNVPDEKSGAMRWSGEDRWADIHTFRYCGLQFDRRTGVATFEFAHEGRSQRQQFTETIDFPLPDGGLSDTDDLRRFERLLELLYVAVGTAYYKAVAPPQVSIDAMSLAPAALTWAQQLYRDGLAEFAYDWQLEHVLDLPITARERAADGGADDRGVTARPLVAMSGGKDSILAFEVLAGAGLAPATFTVDRRPKPHLADILAKTPGPQLWARPRTDPDLSQLTRQKAVRSGHAPLTAMTTLVGVVAAALHGFGPVVMANERSADDRNLRWCGRDVNHQWSKSGLAESALNDAIREHAGVESGCFSLLRGMSELTVCGLFASFAEYDSVVSSCNVVSRSTDPDRKGRWCLNCPKCRWVFLGLAVFMSKPRLLGIFGRDLLDDPAQLDGFRELLGLTGHKPFECVGEVAEARVALSEVAALPQWRDSAVVEVLAGQVPRVPAAAAAQVWRVDPPRWAPARYRAALEDWVAASPVPHGGS